MTNPNPWAGDDGPAPRLVVVARYRVGAAERADFIDAARSAVAVLAEQPGFESGGIGQSMDDASLLTITTFWRDAGAYRHALSSFDVKAAAVPLLSRAVDEPTAYELLHDRTPEAIVDAATGLVVEDSDGGAIVGARVVGRGQ